MKVVSIDIRETYCDVRGCVYLLFAEEISIITLRVNKICLIIKKFKKEKWKLRGMRLFEEMLETIKNRYAGKNWKKIMEEERDIEDQIY